jgi:phage tail protein X
MLCPYFKLASWHSYGRTRGTVKEINEMNFEIKK